MKTLQKVVFAALIGVPSVATTSIAFARQPVASATQDSMSDGEIKKVDKEAGRLTIKHGELKNLGMPGMTMVFKVKDPAMLDMVKPGDKVRFVADKVGGALTVMSIEAVP